jgi:hypothetical protein
MRQKHYLDIERLKGKYANCFQIREEIIVETKVDGANASFSYDPETDTVLAFSRKNKLNEINNLRGFWNWTQRLDKDSIARLTCEGRYIIFGEFLVPHTVKYPENRYNNFYMFDVWDTITEQYLPFEDTYAIFSGLERAARLTNEIIYFVPVLYQGEFQSWEHLYKMMEIPTLGGMPCEEGIVIKTQDRLNDKDSKIPKYIKIVNEKFSEVHKDNKKPINPEELKRKEVERNFVATVVTPQRIEKIIYKLVDSGTIPEDWDEKDMGTIAKILPKLVYEDCRKEENDTVMAVDNFGKIAANLTMEYTRDLLKKK